MGNNGYNKSVIQKDHSKCWFCGYGGDLARHEAFEGTGRRAKSKRLGLWVSICPVCHELCHCHPQTGIALMLKQEGQRRAMRAFDWTTEDFVYNFGKNYIGMEDFEEC